MLASVLTNFLAAINSSAIINSIQLSNLICPLVAIGAIFPISSFFFNVVLSALSLNLLLGFFGFFSSAITLKQLFLIKLSNVIYPLFSPGATFPISSFFFNVALSTSFFNLLLSIFLFYLFNNSCSVTTLRQPFSTKLSNLICPLVAIGATFPILSFFFNVVLSALFCALFEPFTSEKGEKCREVRPMTELIGGYLAG